MNSMEWLKQSFGGPKLELDHLIWRLGMSFLLGGVVALIYRWTRRHAVVAPTFPATLVLLAILIAMVTQVIGDNVARAFSLVGALSIVRFRTVVRDTQDTAFVIFAVVVGMAVGADQMAVALVGLVITGAAAFIMRPRKRSGEWTDSECDLVVRIGLGHDHDALLKPLFDRHIAQLEIAGVTTARQGAAIEIRYRVRLKLDASPADLVRDLNKVEGVQSVELLRDGATP